MKIKTTSIILFFLFALQKSYAQKTEEIFLPPLSTNTPAWFKVFYEKDNLNKINVFNVDKDVAKYKEAVEKQNVKAANEILTGEENEDLYTLYFMRWRRSIEPFVKDNGTIDAAELTKINTTENKNYKAPASRMPASAWSLMGPKETFMKFDDDATQPPTTWQENIYACQVAPSNTNILYAAPETGGLFKTIDKGLHWTSLMDNLNPGVFYAIAINPFDPNIVYAAKASAVYKSIDGGASWTAISVSCSTVNTIVIRPSDTSQLFIASANGIFASVNSGATWAVVAGMTGYAVDVAINPANDMIIYAMKHVGGFTEFWKSTDGGVTFAASITGWTGRGITVCTDARMAVTPADPNRVYAVLLSGAAPVKPFIFRSDDAGATWDTTCTGVVNVFGGSNTAMPCGLSNGQGFYDLDIVANALNADEVIVASTSAFRSTDGGATFNPLGGYVGPFSLHPDTQEMISVGGDTWIATDGGMNYSNDFFATAASHSARNNGIYGSDFWGFTQGWNEDLVAGGRYHNGNTLLYENYVPGNALRLGGAESGTGYCMMGRERNVVFSDIGPGVVIPYNFNGSVGAFPFNIVPNENGYGWDASQVQFFPYCYNIIYSGSGNELWKSTDGGNSWVSVHNFGTAVKKFEVCRSNPNVIYVAASSTFKKSIDGGITWTTITLPSGCAQTELKISVSFDNENILWITSPSNTSNNRVFKSTDGGATWLNLTTPTINSEAYVYSAHQAGTDGGIYIIGNGGKVFYRNNALADWVDYSAGLPGGFAPLKIIPFYRDGKLRAAGNRGFWEIPFFEDSAPIAQPTVDKLTSTCTRDTFYFDDFSALKHLGATWSWSITPAPAYISSTTVRNPKAMFTTLGTYSVTLTVTNSMGTSTKTINNMISITGNQCGPDTIPGKMLTLHTVGDYASQSFPMGISTNTLTISLWLKPDTIEPSYAGIVFTGSSGACGINFKDNNQIGYHWRGTPSSYNWAGGPTVPSNQWSHLCLVITPTDNTIYLNGDAYVHSNTHDSATFNQIFQFGKDRGFTSRNFRGSMDEVCIYNRALSADEVRQLMNLTRNNPNTGSMPAYDPSLLAYYQFNEGAGLPVYDKVGVNHLNLDGGAIKTNTSTAPVGGGVYQRFVISSPGITNFFTPGVLINSPPTGTYPNGDVVVTRLNVPSDRAASYYPLPDNPISYYIIRNYGTNSSFSPLASLSFQRVQGTSSTLVAHPHYLKLYARPMNADSLTWINGIDSASLVTNAAGTGIVTFSAGLNITQFGQQFAMGNTDPAFTFVPPIAPPTPDISVFPNPTGNGWISVSISSTGNARKASITVVNTLGQVVKRVNIAELKDGTTIHINIPTAGIYFITTSLDNGTSATRKAVVE